MSFEQVSPLEQTSTLAPLQASGLDHNSSSSGASMPPPPFQLQVTTSDGAGGATTLRAPERTQETGAGALISENILIRIYTVAADGAQARTFVSGLSEEGINAAYTHSQSTVATETADRAAHPLDSYEEDSLNQYQHVQWDAEGFEEDSEDDWGGANISPRDTGTDPATLREAFEVHRLNELKRLFDAEVELAQVMAARDLAAAQDSPLAEGVRRLLFMANEYAVVQTLNPEQSQRYRPGRLREGSPNSQTYCNTYVLDAMRAMGVAERALPGGRANNLSNAMHRRGMRNYWTEITEGAEAAQARADAGRLVVITAHGTERARRPTDRGDGPFYNAGHISLVLPQNDALDAHAGRAEDGTFSPLESNAGGGSTWVGEGSERRPSANWRFQNRAELYQGNEEVYLRNRRGEQRNRAVDWWNVGHTDGAFWEYTGSLSNPEALNSPEVTGAVGRE